MDYWRRKFCVGVSAITATTIAGCCGLRSYPSPSSQISDFPALRKPTLKRPLSQPPQLSVVDAHAHFFNASDVAVQGYLAHSVGHSAHPILHKLIRAVAPLADWIATYAPTAKEEFDDLVSKTPRSWEEWEIRADKELRILSSDFAKVSSGAEFEDTFNRIMMENRSGSHIYPPNRLSSDTIYNAVSQAMALRESRGTNQIADTDAAYGFLVFLGLMLSQRSNNLVRYQQVYRQDRGPAVSRVLGSLVDFDYWLDCPPRSGHDDQVKLHAFLGSLSDGFMKPLVAYNPWSDIKENGASLERCVTACEQYGFVGVKIYPPMGYAPWGNSTTGDIDSFDRPDLNDLDEKMLTMFCAFAERGIPVMAHTKRSKGRDYDHDGLADPIYWNALLETIQTPNRCSKEHPPVLNLAHFGGQDDTYGPQDDPKVDRSTQRIVEEVMSVQNGTNVFADIGFWTRIRFDHTDGMSDAGKRLQRVLKMSLPNNMGNVADRVLFGTDWYMITIEPDWAFYLEQLVDAISEIASTDDVQKIFHDNAVKMLNRKTEKNHGLRHDDSLSQRT